MENKGIRIELRSDFRDFYDHWFDAPPCDIFLDRMMTGGLSKREQFQLLERIGFTTPLNGIVEEVWDKSANHLVVYTNEQSHCGEGKELYHKSQAVAFVPKLYCSIFIPTTEDPQERAVSRRLLAIGDRMWWLRYESEGRWQSNNAPTTSISVVSETLNRRNYALEGEHDFAPLAAYPLFAVDFVESLVNGQLLAIDFNSAPGLKNTGIEEYVSAVEVVGLLAEFFWKRSFGSGMSSRSRRSY